MSGIKDSYVKLNADKRQRLLAHCEQVNDFESDLAQRLAESAQRFRQFLERHLPQLQENNLQENSSHHSPLDSHSNHATESLDNLEQQQRQTLQELLQQEQTQLTDLTTYPVNQQAHRLQQIEQQLTCRLAEQQRHFQQQYRRLYQSQLERRQTEDTLAELWLNRLRRLGLQLAAHSGLDYQPVGFLNSLDETLTQCDQYYQRGYYQAALATSHEAYLRAQQHFFELEQGQFIHTAWQGLIQHHVDQLRAKIDVQKQAQFRIRSGQQEVLIAADIDYWTEGKLSQLEQKLNDLTQYFSTSQLPLAELKNMVAQLEQQQQQLSQLTHDAQAALIASQLRHNMGQIISHSLANAGWEVIDATYAQEDYRRAMHLKLRNYQGDEIVTIIQPETRRENTLAAHLNIGFFEQTIDETARQRRLQQIIRALQQQGLSPTPPTCRPGTEQQRATERQWLDFERARRRRTDSH
ncbi:hypothetical protein [Thioflexithrix psekupsensis]|uniref:Uncharacterized protein n=1 Tax=Thioflexithrix psekupsensis TaxID=1570016 RepID=A0A251X9V6_9GAMM|nr:hypothetical protein [Thioflexithrix psekupsensis]OUD14574.1 hypothetical protein TPSD3_09815 [Thioflexithrix psekupsensis]